MKAIEFEQQNVVFAKDQKEYLPLPAFAQPNGLVTFCMQLEDSEYEEIKNTKMLKLTVLTFGRSAQPIRVVAIKPEFPVTHKGFFQCNPKSWNDEQQSATFWIELFPLQLRALKKSKVIWITTCTFGTPLQPISMILNTEENGQEAIL
jgi:hypothetical protein